MFTDSTRLVLLGMLFSSLTNLTFQILEMQMFPEVEQNEQVIEALTTLTLTCVEMLDGSNPIGNEIQWTVPRNLFNNKTNKVKIIIYSNYLYPNVKKKRLCSLWVQMGFLLEMDRTKKRHNF